MCIIITYSLMSGPLKCGGQRVASEVVYWKVVPGKMIINVIIDIKYKLIEHQYRCFSTVASKLSSSQLSSLSLSWVIIIIMIVMIIVIMIIKSTGDHNYESPITPHHDSHHTKYITVAYDYAGMF